MFTNKKRWVLCLILSSCLAFSGALSGCTKQQDNQDVPIITENSTKTDTTESSTAPAQPETLQKTDEVLAKAPEVYAYAVRVTINPDFVFYLHENGDVFSYEPLNEDAKKMDAEGRMMFVDRPFNEAVKDLIMVAIDDGFLKEGVDVKITLLGTTETESATQDLLSRAHKSMQDTAKERSLTIVPTIEVDSVVQYAPDPSQQSEEPKTEESEGQPEDEGEEESDKDEDEDSDEDAKDENKDGDEDEDAEDNDGDDGDGDDADDEDNEEGGEPRDEHEGCSVCQGTGVCTRCDGTGREHCYRCDGSGVMPCPSCDGAGYEDCECEGGLCDACDGSGLNEDGDPCPTCEGSGQCQICGGTSVRDCPHCDGTGMVTCEDCDGEGTVVCHCGGTGLCEACGGTGIKPED
ncbi:MAG: hypothetical protein IJM83_00575 [Firmicutes bacterium]|nr:hypothetical protein [Bacillota bacterium]